MVFNGNRKINLNLAQSSFSNRTLPATKKIEMINILRIHKKILAEFLRLRKKNPDLYFVPRKINNEKRLEKGYWFIGNDAYLQVSFWNGSDWKEKIHSISLVVLNDGRSYIELSAQDSTQKAKFLEKLALKIGGFNKSSSKNKWFKHYDGKDYITNLNHFITNVKPIIDNLILTEKPKDITTIDEKFFKKYFDKITKIRNSHIQLGQLNKLSKICWNTENWRFPSGSKGKSISQESYETDSGYGHEEWLFDKTKNIDGYHYSFLQPLNITTDKHENEIYNISLYTINNQQKVYYVGEIQEVECLTTEESIRVFKIYKSNGWIDNMKKDIERVGANHEKFLKTTPEIFFNIRFKFENLNRPDELQEISDHDINVTTNRYKLLPKSNKILIATIPEDDGTEGNKKNTNRRKRVFNSDSEFDPYHDIMQNAIVDLLRKSKKYDYKKVIIEKSYVDIKAITKEGAWHYFEIKTSNPKQSIRLALGQILEYAFFPNKEKAEKLIIIADEKPNDDVIIYLEYIRNRFDLPITYRHFNLEKNELSDDY